jgi:uncharacterized heparinase superfamily protein
MLFGRADFKAVAGQCWEETFWLMGRDAPDTFARLPDEPPSARSVAFPDGGFFVLRSRHAHVIVDCGEVGMKGRGGHGHNDILSFELFLNGFNVVTDCGAYLYTASREWRNTFRSTAFHNTVQVDTEELNRFVGADALWQLHYDAVPEGAVLRCGDRVDAFHGGHRGYARLESPVAHTRELFLARDAPRLLVRDQLDSRGQHVYAWRFHLDPAVSPELREGDVRLRHDEREVWLLPDGVGRALAFSLEPGWVSPSYGVKVPTTVLTWTSSAASVRASFLFAESRLSEGERADEAARLVSLS